MKAFIAKVTNGLLSKVAKGFAFTACSSMCYRPEMPEELKK